MTKSPRRTPMARQRSGDGGATGSMRLNLGCGYDRRAGYLNVDKRGACEPDLVLDLEALPWPWPADSVDEILLKHTLEHLGGDPETYLGIVRELWRVSRNGATITIVVPHPRHDHFLNDPTHVRPVTPEGLMMFSKAKNREWVEKGIPNTPLGLHLDIDLEIVSVSLIPRGAPTRPVRARRDRPPPARGLGAAVQQRGARGDRGAAQREELAGSGSPTVLERTVLRRRGQLRWGSVTSMFHPIVTRTPSPTNG